MFTDMVGYTALAQENELRAMQLLEEHNRALRPIFPKHHGREVKAIGDSFLVEFPSALEAVHCAIDIQEHLRERNRALPEGRRVEVRIGIHVGDVIRKDGDILGDAVNISSRIRPLADPNGICISEQVYDQVRNKVELPLIRMERTSLKNVSLPIDVYRVEMGWEEMKRDESSRPDKHRLVVLPLVNISADPKDDYFADGLTEELITTLAKISGIRVVARTSAMRYKGEKATVGEIGRELKVGSLIEGSVRKSNNKVRIAVQLVDTESQEQLWSEKYDRDLQDIFSVQSDIAQRVAQSLEVKLKASESVMIEKKQTQNPEAYTLYLRGRYHWSSRSEEGVNRAMKYFEEAIGRDPRYALAYVGLADCYSILGFYGYRRPAVVYPRARELAEKGLQLDDSLAEAHASLGETLMQYYLDWNGAGMELQRAVDLNPSYATARMWKATHHVALGKMNESLAEIRKAKELDPLSMIILTDAGKDLYLARQNDAAIEQYKDSLRVDPNFAIAHKGLAEVYVQKSMYDEALNEIGIAISLSKRSVFILDDLGYIYASSGKKEEAMKVLDDLSKLASEEYVPAYGRAVIYSSLGDKDKAIEWLERAYEERSFWVYFKVDPIFDSLRNDERFNALLQKIGL